MEKDIKSKNEKYINYRKLKKNRAEFVKFFYKNNFNIALHYNKSKKQAIKLSKLLRYKKSRVVIVKGDLSSEKGAKKIFSDSKKNLVKLLI